MKLPIIKNIVSDRSIYEDDIDTVVKILEIIGMSRGLSMKELDVIGELLSNLQGAKIVMDKHRHYGIPLKDALNEFMKRVINSTKYSL